MNRSGKYGFCNRVVSVENDTVVLRRELHSVLQRLEYVEALLKDLEARDKATGEYLEFLRARRRSKNANA